MARPSCCSSTATGAPGALVDGPFPSSASPTPHACAAFPATRRSGSRSSPRRPKRSGGPRPERPRGGPDGRSTARVLEPACAMENARCVCGARSATRGYVVEGGHAQRRTSAGTMCRSRVRCATSRGRGARDCTRRERSRSRYLPRREEANVKDILGYEGTRCVVVGRPPAWARRARARWWRWARR